MTPFSSSSSQMVHPRSVSGSWAESPALNLYSCGGNENRRIFDRLTSPTTWPPLSWPRASGSPVSSDGLSVRTWKYRHHAGLASRRGQTSRSASSALACCSDVQTSRSSGRPSSSPARTWAASSSSAVPAGSSATGRGRSRPMRSASSTRRPSHPAPQRQRRPAVVLVVSRHHPPRAFRPPGRPLLQRRLEDDQLLGRLAQRHLPRIPAQRLQPLDRIALHPRPDALPHHPVQIDEHAAPEQVVNLILTGREPPHQPPDRLLAGAVQLGQVVDRGRLVVVVGGDLQPPMPAPPLDD